MVCFNYANKKANHKLPVYCIMWKSRCRNNQTNGYMGVSYSFTFSNMCLGLHSGGCRHPGPPSLLTQLSGYRHPSSVIYSQGVWPSLLTGQASILTDFISVRECAPLADWQTWGCTPLSLLWSACYLTNHNNMPHSSKKSSPSTAYRDGSELFPTPP